jgi:hypothetical protein
MKRINDPRVNFVVAYGVPRTMQLGRLGGVIAPIL